MLSLKEEKEFFESIWKCNRPIAGDEKEHGYRMTREDALTHKYIQTHPKNAQNLIVFDFDTDKGIGELGRYTGEEKAFSAIYEGTLPEPFSVSVNRETRGAHVVYAIPAAVGTPKGIDYFTATRTASYALVGSDMGYINSKMKNPFNDEWETQFFSHELHSLKDWNEHLDLRMERVWKNKNPLPELGRHNILFNELAAWSYREWRKPNFLERQAIMAERLNSQFDEPLKMSDVNSTARSIQRFIERKFSEAEFSKIQSNRANKRWKGQGDKTNTELLMMLDAGLTIREISIALDKTLSTTRRAVGRAKLAAKKVD